ncbi:MAG: thymidylate synthase [Methanocorpusculum sp.]|uniref:thymidylate synthase n=1 Tax=Methanocorpusculum sp. TaxID=2058474 RepID=UPI002721C292|nr:thymidylate synthase [Methanocorpusculum sp.]MDO9522931.1 thymidylate synthase [Methanocorpusculum sp.]
MKLLRAPDLARAHELVIRYILEKGTLLTTENGEETVETDEVCLCIDTPLASPMVSPCSRFKEAFLDEYARNLIEGSDSVFEYDYHGRLFDWGCGLSLNGEIHQDQIQYIIDKLQERPVSRRAVAITWCPPVDEKLVDCPCLQLVQCVVREGKLNMKIVFRSNDMLSAAGSNMFALAKLQEYMAEKIGVGVGTYTHISLVPHVYYKRDAADIPPFCGKGAHFTPRVEVCRVCGVCPKSKR